MMSSKKKCEVQHLGRSNPNPQDRLGTSGLESSFAEQELGVLAGRR